MEILPAAEIEAIGFDVRSVNLLDRAFFVIAQHDTQRGDDALRDLVLNLEDVLELPVVSFRPQLLVVVGVDQLSSETQTLPGLAYASLENRRRLELAAYLADVLVLPLEAEG